MLFQQRPLPSNPREVMCEVHSVELQDVPTADDSTTYDDIVSQVNIPDN